MPGRSMCEQLTAKSGVKWEWCEMGVKWVQPAVVLAQGSCRVSKGGCV